MKQKALNLFLTLCGGFVSQYCKLWQNKDVLSDLPQNKIGTYNKANKAMMAFEQENEREPSVEELAGILEMSENDIASIIVTNVRHTSLDAPVHEAEDLSMGDLLNWCQ
jgi:DNA-directed RNA polymerase specialized sigma subunit